MITKSGNIRLVAQIANLFYPTNLVGKANLISRLTTYLNDVLFELILSQLSYGQYYYAKIKNVEVGNNPGNIYRVHLQFIDLFKGTTWTGFIQDIPATKAGDYNFWFNKIDFNYLGTITANNTPVFIVQNPTAANYGIVYDPAGGGSGIPGGSGGSGSSGGQGEVHFKGNEGKKIVDENTTVPTNSIFGNLDLNSLLLPGVILLAAYFWIKK